MRTSFAIRLALHGCANRPFYHIVVLRRYKARNDTPVDQVGSFDPLPNKHNEKLVAFNFERLRYWIARGAMPSSPVEHLLGLCGFFPLHPRTYLVAKRNRKAKLIAASSSELTEEEKTDA